MLAGYKGIEVIGESADGHEALKMIQKIKPDIVLLDLSMPKINGYSVMREIKRLFSVNIKILVISIHDSDHHVLQAFEEGADGYCIKDSSVEELRLAIRSVLEGKRYISPGIADQVMEGYLNGRRTLKEKSDWDTITQREREVLKLLAEGYMNKEIADFLTISVKTVEKHRANIMNTLDLHNAAALTAYAIEKGLVTPKM